MEKVIYHLEVDETPTTPAEKMGVAFGILESREQDQHLYNIQTIVASYLAQYPECEDALNELK